MTSDWSRRAVSAAEVVEKISSGATIFVHGAAATPTPLLEAMVARKDLTGIKIYHLHTAGPAYHCAAEHSHRFRTYSLFTGEPLRKAVEEGIADYVPIFLSDVPALFYSQAIRLDVAIVQLSPPDRHGYCTLGTSCDAARAAVDTATIRIAEINERMPRTHGNTLIPISQIDAFMRTDRALHEHPPGNESAIEARIGELVAGLVPDRACLQLGIGGIPDATLARLKEKQDLGIHTEMFAEGIIDLLASGAITNRYKSVHPGRIVTSFVNGSRRLFDFIDDNPLVEFHPCDRTNDTSLIRKNDNVVAVNSAIQIDLSGQICADSIGHRIFSGIGGQMDFIRGAALSRGGKAIIALPSTAKSGAVSRIVPELTAGAGVVTTRGHVQWVVTEFGAVNLHGKSLRERGALLTSIAHPDFQAELKAWLRQVRHYVINNVTPLDGSDR